MRGEGRWEEGKGEEGRGEEGGGIEVTILTLWEKLWVCVEKEFVDK